MPSKTFTNKMKRMRRAHGPKMFFATAFFMFLVFIFMHSEQVQKLERVKRRSILKIDTKVVLFWFEMFGYFSWYMGESPEAGEDLLKSVECPVTNCFFTHDHNFLEKVTEFDAIFFHIPDNMNQMSMPDVRNENQIYIMASKE